MILRWLAPIFILLCVGCGGAYKWDTLKLEDLPKSGDYPENDGVVLLDSQDVHYESDAETGEPVAIVSVHRRMRYFTKATPTPCGVIHTKKDKVLSMEGRTIQPPLGEDKKPEIKKKNLRRATSGSTSGSRIFTERQTTYITSGAVRAGSVAECRTKVRYVNPRVYPHTKRFGGYSPSKKVSLTVSFPSNWSMEHRALQLAQSIEWAPEKATANGRTTLSWTAENLPPMALEDNAPEISFRAKKVGVWLSKWTVKGAEKTAPADIKALSAYKTKFTSKAPEGVADPALAERATRAAFEKHVDELLSGIPDTPQAKTQRLYDWVRQNIRYHQVYLGMGGFIPTPATETRARLFGDCKDKANLLKEMLAHAGIKSRIGILFSAGNGFRNPYTFMTIGGNSNHAILIVDLPDGPVFLDPTDRSVAYGTLPFRDQNAQILPLSEAGDALLTTPGSDATQNWRETEVNLELAPDGSADGEFKFSASGTFADGIRQRLIGQPEAHRPKTVTGYLGSGLLSVTDLNGVDALEPPDAKTPLVISGALSPTHLAASESAAVLLSLDAFNFEVSVIPGADRTSPLLLGAKRRLKSTVKVVVSEGVRPVALPEASTFEYPFAKATLSWGFAEGTLTMERTLEYTQTQIPASDAAAYEKFARALNAASATPIQLTKGGGS